MMGDFVKLVKLMGGKEGPGVSYGKLGWYDMIPPLGFFCLFSLLGGLKTYLLGRDV